MLKHVSLLAAGLALSVAAWAGPKVEMQTTLGRIVIELNQDKAPISTQNFLAYTKENFYTDTVFHRVIPGFMIQGGDPLGTGMGGPGVGLLAGDVDEGLRLLGALQLLDELRLVLAAVLAQVIQPTWLDKAALLQLVLEIAKAAGTEDIKGRKLLHRLARQCNFSRVVHGVSILLQSRRHAGPPWWRCC